MLLSYEGMLKITAVSELGNILFTEVYFSFSFYGWIYSRREEYTTWFIEAPLGEVSAVWPWKTQSRFRKGIDIKNNFITLDAACNIKVVIKRSYHNIIINLWPPHENVFSKCFNTYHNVPEMSKIKKKNIAETMSYNRFVFTGKSEHPQSIQPVTWQTFQVFSNEQNLMRRFQLSNWLWVISPITLSQVQNTNKCNALKPNLFTNINERYIIPCRKHITPHLSCPNS